MFDMIFGSVSGLFHKWDKACIDNHIFRLHYRGTVIIILAATALVTIRCDMSPISYHNNRAVTNKLKSIYCYRVEKWVLHWECFTCDVRIRHDGKCFLCKQFNNLKVTSRQFIGDPINCMSDSMSSDIMNIYCWIHSTYTVNDKYERSNFP